ncbi:MAG: RsmE family RNA methyltransferase, partial [Nitrospira sp.]
MRIHRFYLNTPISDDVFDVPDKELVHQWRSVFRYNVGSEVILFDGSGMEYLAIITSLRNSGASVEVLEKKKNKNKPKTNLWLCVGLIKKDNFELVVQKATELGVSHVIPVLCERSEKKNLNMDRLRKIAVEASEQSGRADIPVIHEIVSLRELLEKGQLPKDKMFLNMDGQYIADVLQIENSKNLAVFIGPEGGWSETEEKEFALHSTPSAVSYTH